MKDFILTKQLDALGLVPLPRQAREHMGVQETSPLDILLDRGRREILLRPATDNGAANKHYVMTRKLDPLGRIVLPYEVRSALKLIEGETELDIFYDRDSKTLTLRPAEPKAE